MRRRIEFVVDSLDYSGASRQMGLLAEHLPRDEFEVGVCALRDGALSEELRERQIPFTILESRWTHDPIVWWKLRRHLRSCRPDVVHTWTRVGNSYGRMAALQAAVGRIVSTQPSPRANTPWHEWALDRYLGQRSQALVVSTKAALDANGRAGLPVARMRRIAPGASQTPSLGSPREELVTELGLPRDTYLIGAVGRLSAEKRLEDLIWSADLLKVIRDDVHLLIVGDGPRRDALVRFRHHCHIDDRVHFLGQRSDVPRLLAGLDLLWQAGTSDSQSTAVLEAMSAGIPVVAADMPGNRDLIVHGVTGFLVPRGDRAGLARYAQKLLADRPLAEQMGTAGRSRAEGQFPLSAMVEQHAELYREIMR